MFVLVLLVMTQKIPPRCCLSRVPLMEAGSQRGSAEEIEWLLMRGLERRAPLPDQLDLESLLSCIAEGQEEALNP